MGADNDEEGRFKNGGGGGGGGGDVTPPDLLFN